MFSLSSTHKFSLSFCSVSPRSLLLLVPAGIHTFIIGLAHFHFGEEQIDVYEGWRGGRYEVGKAVYGVKCGRERTGVVLAYAKLHFDKVFRVVAKVLLCGYYGVFGF